MIRKICVTLGLLAALALGGCATPLGQQYGTVGAIGGAAIGAVTGGTNGAIVGGAIGALGGGAIGDQQTFENERRGGYDRGGYERRPAPRCRMEPSVWYDRWNRAHYDYDHPVRVCPRY